MMIKVAYIVISLGFLGYPLLSILYFSRSVVVSIVSVLCVVIFLGAISNSIKILVFGRRIDCYQGYQSKYLWIIYSFLLHSCYWFFYSVISLSYLNQEFFGVLVRILYCILIPSIGILVINQCSFERLRRYFIHFSRLFWVVTTIAFLQFFLGETALPYFLHSDDRYYLSINALGMTRVNGLIGNPIEFGLSCSLMYYGFSLFQISKHSKQIITLTDISVGALIIMSSSRVFFVVFCALFLLKKIYSGFNLFRLIGKVIFIILFLFVLGEMSGLSTYVYDALFSPYNWSTRASTDLHYLEIGDAIKSFIDSPFFGNGLGDQAGNKLRIVTDGAIWELLVETGIFGVFTFLLFICSFIRPSLIKGKKVSFDTVSILVMSSLVALSQGLNSSLMNILNSSLFFYLISGYFVKQFNENCREL